MANGRIKPEMGKKNGKGRWMLRSIAKKTANKTRRKIDSYLSKFDGFPKKIRDSYLLGSWE